MRATARIKHDDGDIMMGWRCDDAGHLARRYMLQYVLMMWITSRIIVFLRAVSQYILYYPNTGPV